MSERKKVLITGSVGFIFSNFIRKAIYEKHPYSFVSVDRISRKNLLNSVYANKNHQFYMADILDQHVLDNIFAIESPEIVIHAAAETFVDTSIENPSIFATNNIVGTQNVINSCLRSKVKRLIYISSDEIYGQLRAEDPPWNEEAPLKPRNPYCLAGDTNILLSNGSWTTIKEIKENTKIGSYSFSDNAPTYSAVSNSLNKTGTKLLAIKTEFGSIHCSPEHTLFVKQYLRNKKGKINYRAVKRGVPITEKTANEINVGDFLALARTDKEPITVINIDTELAKFLGYFVGDGCVTRNSKIKNTKYIKLADQSKTNLLYYAELVRSFSKRLFGREVKTCLFKHRTKNCWTLSFGCLPLVDIIHHFGFDVYAKHKQIKAVFNWSNDAVFNFLGGLFDADGTMASKRCLASFSSSSFTLLNDVKLLLRRAGILAHEIIKYEKTINNVHYLYGKINISDSKSIALFNKQIKTYKIYKGKLHKPQINLDNDNIIFVRVQNIEQNIVNETLYDLTVPETSNFIANGFIVHNSASKASGELLVRAASETYGLPYNIIRPSNNYGPRQTQEKFIPKVIKCVLDKKPIPVYGQGLQCRDWTHVFDNCAGILHIMNRGQLNETYNISSCQEFSNIEVVHEICKALGGGDELVTFVPDRPGHDFRYAVDTTKIRNIGWNPTIKFKTGIISVVEWYVNNRFYLNL